MAYLKNENIITLIFKNLSLFHISQLYKTIFNETINTAILKILNLKNIFKTMGGTKTFFNGHYHFIRALATLEDNNLIVSASSNKVLKVWDVELLSCIRIIDGHNAPVYFVIALDNGIIA
jgi:WD40 repeat protein